MHEDTGQSKDICLGRGIDKGADEEGERHHRDAKEVEHEEEHKEVRVPEEGELARIASGCTSTTATRGVC